MHFLKVVLLMVVVSLVGACGGPFTRIIKHDYQNIEKDYEMDLPLGWVQATGYQAAGSLWISKDGYSLQSIRVDALTEDKAFITLKKSATTDMAISDLAELELAEFKAKNANLASVEVLANELSKISEQNAYRLHLQYLNDKGLRIERVTYGFVSSKYYYKLAYHAPTLHYFKRDLPVYEEMVKSFRLVSRKIQ